MSQQSGWENLKERENQASIDRQFFEEETVNSCGYKFFDKDITGVSINNGRVEIAFVPGTEAILLTEEDVEYLADHFFEIIKR